MPYLTQTIAVVSLLGALYLFYNTCMRVRKAIKILRNMKCQNVVELQQYEEAMAGMRVDRYD